MRLRVLFVKELKKKLKMVKKEHRDQLAEKDQQISDLQCQVSEHTKREKSASEVEEIKAVTPAPVPSTMLQKYRTASPVVLVEEEEHLAAVKVEPSIAESLPTLPNWDSLLPCLRTAFRPEDTTSSIPKSILRLSKSADPLYCHTYILWNSDVPHEAYLIRPSQLYDPTEIDSRQWGRNPELDQFQHGHSRETFYLTEQHVHYAGTYTCWNVKELLYTEHSALMPGTIPQEMQLQSLLQDRTLSPDQRRRAHREIYHQYREGHTKLVCITLRYTGFNERLYQELVALYTQKYGHEMDASYFSQKRKHAPSGPRGNMTGSNKRRHSEYRR